LKNHARFVEQETIELRKKLKMLKVKTTS
jgi:hypothetical protein